jgi:hypothetical protein
VQVKREPFFERFHIMSANLTDRDGGDQALLFALAQRRLGLLIVGHGL